ncbi:MAG: zinc-dependent alcohol dehydrogenase family protein [Verrucomicrobiota bacterium]
MKKHTALRHHAFGQPDEVLRLEEVATPEPESGEVRVKLLSATINPSDYGMIGGSYGHLRELPAVAGREGVGEVDALGANVTGVSIGQRVRFPETGAWQGYACIDVNALLPVPMAIPLDQAAISFINPPTAYCLLKEVVDLKPGSWVLQNAGNSAVGLSVIQIAKAFGLKTISEVRRESLVAPLCELGADHVVIEGEDWVREVESWTDGQGVQLALNSIGGQSAIRQIKTLASGGTQVTFGGMVGEPVRFPTRYLIFNDVRLVGFWWDQWSRRHGVDAVKRVMDGIYGMMQHANLELMVEAAYPFAEYKEAFAHDKRPRLGKILLKP